MRHGVRKDCSRRGIQRTLARGAALAREAALIVFHSDEKSTYPGLVDEAFAGKRVLHVQTNSRLVRATWNPLFPINHEEALARDLMSRLRRQSWLVSKRRRYLDLGLHIHIAYRNLVRKRFNKDHASPAQLLGFAPRRLTAQELLSWRQDWGASSLHPLSKGRVTVTEGLKYRSTAA